MSRSAKIAIALLAAVGIGVIAADLVTTLDKPPAVKSVSLSPAFYGLGVKNRNIEVTGGISANDCGSRLFNPTSLRLVQTSSSCTSEAPSKGPLIVDDKTAGDELHVAITNPVTHKTSVGPLLMTIQNWSWNHSGVTSGGGSLWVFGLSINTLLQVSLKTGRIENHWNVKAGADPWMAVNADGFWMTPGVWGGSPFCANRCALWHVAPGSSRLVDARNLKDGTQWFKVSDHSIYLDELTRVPKGFSQSVWRIDGPSAKVAYRTKATLLPAPDFGGTGYIVEGDPQVGYFTLSQLGTAHTQTGIGDCDSSSRLRIVRIDPVTGNQSYVATLPATDDGTLPECHFDQPGQTMFYDNALYFLSDVQAPGNQFGALVRVSV